MKAFISFIFISFISAFTIAQPPGPPPGMPGVPGGRGPQRDWVKDLDANKDGKIDSAELQTGIDASFTEFDKNSDGVLSETEIPRPLRGPEGGRPPMGQGIMPGGQPPMRQGMGPRGPEGEGKKILPPFFFGGLDQASSISKADLEKNVRRVFAEMDKNGDGSLTRDEARPPRRGEGSPENRPPLPPNAKFISAEMRFGDKFVKGQPFSADIVIEDTRRLFDGSTVTKNRKGAFYRDSAGRTRREQPLEMVGDVAISNSDGAPQMLVFINDFATHTNYFLDVNRKIARQHKIGGNPPPDQAKPENAKSESLGTKTIEGVNVEGTRSTFEIPAGQIGNDKPIQVVTETWFSPDLQMVVYSRHVDPLAGEHVFKLVNIKRADPASDLFTVPSGFKVEVAPNRGPE